MNPPLIRPCGATCSPSGATRHLPRTGGVCPQGGRQRGCVGRGDLTPPRMCAARESARADMESAPTVVVGRCRAASPLAVGQLLAGGCRGRRPRRPGAFPLVQTGTGEQCSPLQEFFDILSNTQSPSRVRPGRALRFQEAYSRSSVSIKCTGSMMRRPSALGAAVSSRACSISSFVRAGATCQPSAMTPTQ